MRAANEMVPVGVCFTNVIPLSGAAGRSHSETGCPECSPMPSQNTGRWIVCCRMLLTFTTGPPCRSSLQQGVCLAQRGEILGPGCGVGAETPHQWYSCNGPAESHGTKMPKPRIRASADFDTRAPSWQNGRVPMITSPQAAALSTRRDPTIEDLNGLIRSAGFPGSVAWYERLKGDASNRSYYRIQLKPGSQPATVVLMQLAEPEAFKRSEEAVSGGDASVRELPFLSVQRYLVARGVAVPAIYAYDAAAGRMILEDLGDCTLFDAVAGASPERIEAMYRQAIDELVTIQTPLERGHPQCVAFTRRFDPALLLWELDHFLEYGIEARNGIVVPPTPRESIRRAFARIAEELAAAPSVFVHRDYHSRNLMLTGDRLRVIDFQDALTGPQTYDLASLLRDSYVTLDDALVDRLVAHYLRSAHPSPDPAAFRRLFDITGFQRNLKAAGRFIYIEKVKGRPTHLPYVTPTLRSARRVLTTYPDLSELRALLAPYVPEFT